MGTVYFKAYHSYLETIEPLNDAERGRLFTACLQYSKSGEVPELRGNERFIFAGLKAQIDRDANTYADTCRKNAENINIRWNTNVYDRIPPYTNDTKDKEKDKDKDIILPSVSPLPGDASAPKRKKPSTLSVAQQALFNRFWNAYPRKESIGDAEKAWDKLNADEALTDTIVAGIERAIVNDHRFREKQYTPHPASWLNGKDWMNEYDDTQEPTRRHRRVN